MELKRELRLLDVFCVAAGAMISSGIFVLPGIAHARAGPGVILSYFLAGLLNWFALALKSAFALIGMSAFVRLFSGVGMLTAGIGLTAVFTVVNLLGARQAVRFQVAMVLGLLLLMAGYIVQGLPRVNLENMTPFFPRGVGASVWTAGFVFVAYGGLLKISSIAEEVKDPVRNIPRGLILSLVVVMLLYTAMVFVTTGVLPGNRLDDSLTPITDGAAAFAGPWGGRIMALAAVFAFVSTANAGILAAARYLLALGRDELLPGCFARISRRTRVPWVAVLVTGLFVASSLLLPLDTLVEAASLIIILGFVLSCVCIIVLRESQVQNYRPGFRAPFYPFLQIAGILGFSLLVFKAGIHAFLIFSALFSVGLLSYWFYGRNRLRKDYALLHLVERLTSRELVTGTLEQELKEVVRDRDEIPSDRLDQLVATCPVLDMPRRVTAEQCFEEVAGKLAEALRMKPSELADKLLEREGESSTVLTPFLAIPHTVVPGEGSFGMALVRNREGILFGPGAEGVKAMFVLAGTRDERNFHLRALAGIAQTVQEPGFEKRWMNARGIEGLRDVLLLAKRVRSC